MVLLPLVLFPLVTASWVATHPSSPGVDPNIPTIGLGVGGCEFFRGTGWTDPQPEVFNGEHVIEQVECFDTAKCNRLVLIIIYTVNMHLLLHMTVCLVGHRTLSLIIKRRQLLVLITNIASFNMPTTYHCNFVTTWITS